MQTVRIFSSDIGMTFGIEKCAIVEMKRGKLIESDGLNLPEGQMQPISTLEYWRMIKSKAQR